MTEFVAFLRGINVGGRGMASMADLRASFEDAGFKDVRTIGSSGNVAFASASTDAGALAAKARAAMRKRLGMDVVVHVHRIEDIRTITSADPYAGFRFPKEWKKVVTFLGDGEAKTELRLPMEKEFTAILAIKDGAAFSVYGPNPKGALFMTVLEKAFGKDITTRTWDMLSKLSGNAPMPKTKNPGVMKTCSRGHKYKGSRCPICWPGGAKRAKTKTPR
jgi:uncharacterized protein (DUF1697 family)